MNARIFAFACLVLVPFAAGAQAEEHWTFSVTPYIWLPNVNGTLKYNPPPSGGAPEVDTGPNNYLENLSFALMLSGEARKGRWSIVSDLIYLKFDKEKSNVRDVDFGGSRVNTSADVGTRSSLKGLEWTIAGAYTMVQSPRYTLEGLGGLRYFHVEASSDWQLAATVSAPGGAQTLPASGNGFRSTDLVDGIVGVRGRIRWGSRRTTSTSARAPRPSPGRASSASVMASSGATFCLRTGRSTTTRRTTSCCRTSDSAGQRWARRFASRGTDHEKPVHLRHRSARRRHQRGLPVAAQPCRASAG